MTEASATSSAATPAEGGRATVALDAERQVATRTDLDIYSKMMLFRLGSDHGLRGDADDRQKVTAATATWQAVSRYEHSVRPTGVLLSWCDKLASTPSAGFGLDRHFATSGAILPAQLAGAQRLRAMGQRTPSAGYCFLALTARS